MSSLSNLDKTIGLLYNTHMLPTFDRANVLVNHALNNGEFQRWLTGVNLSTPHPLLERATELLQALSLTDEQREILNAWGVGKLTTTRRLAQITYGSTEPYFLGRIHDTSSQIRRKLGKYDPKAKPLFKFQGVIKGIGVTTRLQPNQLAAIFELRRANEKFYPKELLSEKLTGRQDKTGIHHTVAVICRAQAILPPNLKIESATHFSAYRLVSIGS